MAAVDLTARVYRSSVDDLGAAPGFVRTFWSHLRERVPALPEEPESGRGTAEAARCIIRWAAWPETGFLAVALHDADGNSWEAFVVPHADETLRTGWRRRWQLEPAAPYPWKAAADHFRGLLELATPPPDFVQLVCALEADARSSVEELKLRVSRLLD